MSGDPNVIANETKEQLELKKLRADIAKATADRIKAELEAQEIRQWWKRPAFLQPVAVVIVTIVATVVGYVNGFFSTKLESLKNEETAVQAKIEVLNSDKSTLKKQIVIDQATIEVQRADIQRIAQDARRWEDGVKLQEAKTIQAIAEKNKLIATLKQIQAAAQPKRSATWDLDEAPLIQPRVITPKASWVVLSGRVQSQDGKPMVGVEILSNVDLHPVVTNESGKYSIEVQNLAGLDVSRGAFVVYRRDGYETVELDNAIVQYSNKLPDIIMRKLKP